MSAVNRRLPYVLIAVAVLAVGFVAFYNGSMQKASPPPGKVIAVLRGNIVSKITETGSVEPASIVEIKSEQSGEVKRLFTAQGDRVEVGQPLAVIQQESNQARQAAQFRATLEEERLNMEEARRELDRQRALFEKGFVSRKEVEVAEKNLEKANVKLQLARRQLLLVLGGNPSVLEQYLSRDIGSDALDHFTIASPIRGTVISQEVEQGEMITSGTATVGGGTTLMKIADLKRMLVKTKINEVNIVQVHLGLPVRLWLDALPDQEYGGRVSQISPQGERANNVVTYLVTVEIEKPDDNLKPSMTANVDIITGRSEGVLVLPIEAVERKDGAETVRVERNGRLEKVGVKTGARTESLVEITDGLREGENVVVLPGEKEKG